MELEPKELLQRMDHLKEGLKRSDVKLTHQRLEIFLEIARSADHPDAETIYKGVRKRLPTISLDTVYRTLWLLLDLGLITTLGPPRGRVRFDANISSHHHFVCGNCGMTRDFYSEDFSKLKIPDEVKSLGSVETTQVEVKGLCMRCSKKSKPKTRAVRKKGEK